MGLVVGLSVTEARGAVAVGLWLVGLSLVRGENLLRVGALLFWISLGVVKGIRGWVRTVETVVVGRVLSSLT